MSDQDLRKDISQISQNIIELRTQVGSLTRQREALGKDEKDEKKFLADQILSLNNQILEKEKQLTAMRAGNSESKQSIDYFSEIRTKLNNQAILDSLIEKMVFPHLNDLRTFLDNQTFWKCRITRWCR
jgi:chromosome segregation ATPase